MSRPSVFRLPERDTGAKGHIKNNTKTDQLFDVLSTSKKLPTKKENNKQAIISKVEPFSGVNNWQVIKYRNNGKLSCSVRANLESFKKAMLRLLRVQSIKESEAAKLSTDHCYIQ